MNQLEYLALGDSYTIGEAVLENERWPHQLVELLKLEGLNFDLPEIIAVTGWTTDELQSAIREKQPKHDFDLLSLLIGVNNQYRGYPIETYKKEFTELLQTAVSTSKKVFVVSIPDYGVTPFAIESDSDKIAKEIDAYNQVAHDICHSTNVPFIDITQVSKIAKSNAEMTAYDGLHPSGEMYKLWANEIFPIVHDLLN